MSKRPRQAPRQPAPPSAYSWTGQIPSFLALAGTLLALAGFYFNTNYAVTDLKTRSENDGKAREQLRESLTKSTEKTSEAIAELTKHAAVQDERTLNITNSLTSIQGQLGNIATSISPAARSKAP